jgi:serine/threonine-protein kinase
MTGIERPAIAIVSLLTASIAWAQDRRDPIAAEALFERGKQLVDQGRTPEACQAFAESQRLDPAGGTLLRLALCHEADKKLASAWLEYLEVVRVSEAGTGEPAKLAERVRIAREHLAAIEPRVPKLAIVVPPAARLDGLQITANGAARNEGTWGVALPLDPGAVEIVATAPARRAFRTTLELAEGQRQSVEIPTLAPEPPPAPSAPASAGTVDRASSSSSSLRPAGIVIGAAGVVGLGVGTYFGLHAISKWHDANAACPGTSGCSADAVTLAQDAKQSARAADLAIGLGAAAVAAGIVLYVVGAPRTVQAQADGVAIAF